MPEKVIRNHIAYLPKITYNTYVYYMHIALNFPTSAGNCTPPPQRSLSALELQPLQQCSRHMSSPRPLHRSCLTLLRLCVRPLTASVEVTHRGHSSRTAHSHQRHRERALIAARRHRQYSRAQQRHSSREKATESTAARLPRSLPFPNELECGFVELCGLPLTAAETTAISWFSTY